MGNQPGGQLREQSGQGARSGVRDGAQRSDQVPIQRLPGWWAQCPHQRRRDKHEDSTTQRDGQPVAKQASAWKHRAQRRPT